MSSNLILEKTIKEYIYNVLYIIRNRFFQFNVNCIVYTYVPSNFAMLTINIIDILLNKFGWILFFVSFIIKRLKILPEANFK